MPRTSENTEVIIINLKVLVLYSNKRFLNTYIKDSVSERKEEKIRYNIGKKIIPNIIKANFSFFLKVFKLIYFHPVLSKTLIASSLNDPSKFKSKLSILKSPHDWTISEGCTFGFAGYS